MRFLARAIRGAIISIVAIAFAAGGVWFLFAAEKPEPRAGRVDEERVFTVQTGVLQNSSVSPRLTSFGRIKSWRQAPVQAAVSGRVIWLSESVRNGASIAAGEVIAKLDSERAEIALSDAQSARLEAEGRQREAAEALALSKAELAAAETTLDLRNRQLQRLRDLSKSGSASRSSLDSARLEQVASEQSLASRKLAVVRAENEVTYAQMAFDRARLHEQRAKRDLAETTIVAPFSGTLSQVTVSIGQELTANSPLAQLIDDLALEAEIEVSAIDLPRLLDGDGNLLPLAVEISLNGGAAAASRPVVHGHLVRKVAEAALAGSARTVIAALDLPNNALLLPGDFVEASILEPPLDAVARVPKTALDAKGGMFLVDEQSRLRRFQPEIAAFTGDEVLLRDVPLGRRYVLHVTSQLAEGVLVKTGGDFEQDTPVSLERRSSPPGNGA